MLDDQINTMKLCIADRWWILFIVMPIGMIGRSEAQLITVRSFEGSHTGVVTNRDVQGWLLQSAQGVNPPAVFEILVSFSRNGWNSPYCLLYSNISFVADVGTQSKRRTYGNKRANSSFIICGIVPGVPRVKPDILENKEEWTFLWGENECVIGIFADNIYSGQMQPMI
jgi:hypothetical protein